MHNNPIHSEVHESKLNVLVAKVLHSGPVRVSVGIVPTGHYFFVLYFLYFNPSEFSEHSLNTIILTPSLHFVQEHSRYKVSVGLEHSRARTESHVHVTWPHLTPHHHCLLWGAAHALQ